MTLTTSATPPVSALSPGAKALGLFLAALALLLLLALRTVFSPPAQLEASEGEAHIRFTASRSSVLLPGECVAVQWEVGGIRAVHLNDQPTVGRGEGEACITPASETQPRLRVRLVDGSVREYRLEIGIGVRRAENWFLGGLALLLVGAAGYVLAAPRVGKWLSGLRPLARRAVRVLEGAVLLVVVLAVALEMGLRLYFTHFGTERERVMYLYSQEDIRHRVGMMMPMPYVNYVAWPEYAGHNRLGYRGPEVEIPKPDGVFRIVALGGSTTYGISTSWEDAYPAQLQSRLREEYGYTHVEVVNAGLSGYSSWDTLANFAFRVLELEPDLVIFYEGINDVQPRAVPGECYRGLNPMRGLNPTRGLFERPQIPISSALYRLLAIPLGWMADPSALDSQYSSFPVECPMDSLTDERIQQNPPVYFERNLRNLILLVQGNHIQMALSTWTYNRNAENGALSPARQAAVTEHNEIIRQLADEYHLPLYDLDATDFWQTREYWVDVDAIHMAVPGTHEQARRYAAFLVEQELIPPPA